ncbi:MAG: hypothetical protein IJI47_05880 [Eubacterium sp.]|nr:hypothetical protein [Eubacterium sp.]
MANQIISKKSNKKVNSPEELSDYIKVSSVGVWLILGVIVLFLVSVFIWGIFGNLETTVDATGVCESGTIYCYMENAAGIEEGDKVKIGNAVGKVVSVSDEPLSSSSVSKKYDEYTAYCLNPAKWSYEITVSCENCPDGVTGVKIITETVKPISFIKG